MTAFDPRPWHGVVYRQIPAQSPFPPLDTHLAGRSREQRWNAPGEPTLLLADSVETVRAELAAHFQRDRHPELATLLQERRVYAIELSLERVFDLTDAAVIDGLAIPNAPGSFADRAVARATAGFLRHVRGAHGIVVPSLALPANPAHWNLVVFLERMPSLEAVVANLVPADTFQLDSG